MVIPDVDKRRALLRQFIELRDATNVEAKRRTAVDVFATLDYQPTEKQREFHDCEAFDVLFGGAAGAGKTAAVLMHGVRAAVEYPGIRVGAFRRSYPELQESLIAELGRRSFANDLGARWNGSEHELRFANKSTIAFRHLETLEDATRRQGGEYQLLLFDERTLMPPDAVSFIYSRLRSGRADVPVLGIRSSSNPGGQGHGAVKARYVTATDHGAKVTTDERGRTVAFIPAKAAHNSHLNPEYVRDLEVLPAAQRAAFLDGSWDSFEGQMFAEWSYERHVVDPFPIPAEWARHGGLDYGYRAPSAAVWTARDPDGRLWIYRELNETGLGEKRLAAALATTERIVWDADPAMWAKTGDALSPADKLATEGIALRKAVNDRVIGWQRLHTFLGEAPACAIHREQGWTTCPLLHVFSSCSELIRTLPALPYARSGNIEDADTHADDHLCDAARYMVMGIGVGGVFIFDADDAGIGRAIDGSELMRDAGGGIAFGKNWGGYDATERLERLIVRR